MSGRPTVITSKVVSLLVASFQNGLTARQACWQSGVSHEAYYQRLRNDPEFADTMSKAQHFASMSARQNIVKAIKNGDTSASRWWLEHRDKEEFTTRIDVINQEPQDTHLPDNVMDVINDRKKLVIAEYQVRMLAKISNETVLYNRTDRYERLEKLHALSKDELYKRAMKAAARGGVKVPPISLLKVNN